MVRNTNVLNPRVLEAVRRVGGAGLVDRLLDYCLAHAPERLQFMREALARNDWKSLEYHAHALKSSSGNLGADALRSVLNEIEAAAEAQRGEAVQAAWPPLETCFDEFLQALQQLRPAA